MEIEESEKRDYFNAFLKTVETDLRNKRPTYVYSKEQLDYIKKKFDVEVIRDEGWCMYIRLKKGGM